MPNLRGTNFRGSLSVEDGGLILKDINLGPRSVEERYARITVTSAEILALFATPKTLVAAPGAGKFIEFLGATIMLDATATAYAGVAAGEDLCIKYTNAAGAIVSTTLETTGFIDQTTDQVRTIKAITTDVTPVVNSPIVLHLLVGEITTGTGVLYVNVSYRIHETGL
jgi:hypothetical protein